MSATRRQGLVLAGGEGTRLSALGIPKPLVPVADEALVVRAVGALVRAGCSPVLCLVREPFATEARAALGERHADVSVLPCTTRSSLHTLGLGLRHGRGPWLATLVDTVMPARDWQLFAADAFLALAQGADIVLAVTSFVDDERPLYLRMDADGRPTAIGEPARGSGWVTAGAYAFSERMAPRVDAALAAGVERLREFLSRAVGTDLCLTTVRVPMTVDVDRPSDLAVAGRLLANEPPHDKGREP